nr:hypothetical protein [Wolbachia endosymbiont of Drosophila incompta]
MSTKWLHNKAIPVSSTGMTSQGH